jgi:hypothetical protein
VNYRKFPVPKTRGSSQRPSRLAYSHVGYYAPFWNVWVPRISSTSCDQAVFVDHATDARVSSDTVLLKIDWFG